MFKSARVKLTAGYLLILMCISLFFSAVIYSVASDEISHRMSDFQTKFAPDVPPNARLFNAYRENQAAATNRNLFIRLAYVNLVILVCGGYLSYLLAKWTLREIEHAHESRARFTSDASHELRTPLTVMKAELEVALNDKKMSREDMREILQSNLEEVDKLTSLTYMLLRISKLENIEVELSKINLTNLVNNLAQKYDVNGKRIKVKAPAKDIYIRSNQAATDELTTILIDNALKHALPSSKITIELSKTSRKGILKISNKTSKIDPQKLPHIFDRFYVADESHTSSGSGLGLSLAKEIVAIHGGELQVHYTKSHVITFEYSFPSTSAK